MIRRYFFVLLIPLVPYVQSTVDARATQSGGDGVLYLSTGEEVRRLCPGLEDLMADVYWLRAVQYNGSQRLKPGREPFAQLDELVDITTTLDPRLEIAYWYGAIFLSEPFPHGKGSPEEGLALLQKGLRNMPDSWRLYQYLGFVHFLYRHDTRAAAQSLLEGARLPGAPFWLRTLAAKLLADGRDRDRARSIWRQILEQAQDDISRRNAVLNLQRLDALDLVEAWNEVARRATLEGRPPSSMADLRGRAAGRLSAVDPAGVPLAYDPATRQVSIARESPLFRGPSS